MSRRVLIGVAVAAVATVGFIALEVLGMAEPAPIESATVVGGQMLVVQYVRSPETCGGSPVVHSEESVDTITVSVEIRTQFQLGTRTCPMVGQYATARVQLSAPLGQRVLIDGNSGELVSVNRRGS